MAIAALEFYYDSMNRTIDIHTLDWNSMSNMKSPSIPFNRSVQLMTIILCRHLEVEATALNRKECYIFFPNAQNPEVPFKFRFSQRHSQRKILHRGLLECRTRVPFSMSTVEFYSSTVLYNASSRTSTSHVY